ncbi:MAG: type I secretion system permease/ATPase [Beijerinckiaceae bacterium]|nr:type I secretion system permease/ATPase [Beijerinckiaceae bacterium]MCZ8300057.1 type I secretion system permease/ATPase [Beijerinckiaceae bacterium]
MLKALLHLAAHHGRAVGEDIVLSGLPLEGAPLGATLFARAARRAGLEAELVHRPFRDISPLVLPCLVFLGSEPVVLRRIDPAGGRCELVRFPDQGGALAAILPANEVEAAYAGYAFLIRPLTPADPSVADKRRPYGWFLKVIRRFRSNYWHIALATLIINVLALVFPLFTMAVYDRVLPNQAVSSLVALLIGVLLAITFDFIIRFARSRMIDLTGKQADGVLAAQIYEHLLNIRMRVRPQRVGVLANQVRDFDSVREFFTSATLIAVTDLLFAFLFIGILFLIAGPLAWISLLLLPVVIAIGILIQRPLDRAMKAFQGEASAKHGLLIESLHGLETVKVMGAQSGLQAAWERSVAQSARAGEQVHHWSSLALTLSNAAQQMTSLGIMVGGAFLVMNNTLSVGALVAANMLAGRVLSPLTNLAGMISRGNQTLIALQGIDALMALETDTLPGEVKTARRIERGAIAFDRVTFGYPGSARPALDEVSFRIGPGERVGIVGKIGSGKTTIGRLLVNLYSPDSGRILLDDADQRQFDPIELRRDIGFVLQDSELFMGTMRRNIALGRPDATDEEIIAAARLAGIDSFVAQNPEGYDMRIAEGGRSLSGGQRQSVALARVLLRRPRILFLDEPTSALDVSSEAEFCARLDTVLGRDTTFIVCTHRVSLLAFVERLLVLENGRLVADGPRDAILAGLNKRPPAARGAAHA